MNFIKINDILLPTKLAITEYEQANGLMYNTNPECMTFVYSIPSVNKFWMKNTPMPLDILFCLNNQIRLIVTGEPYSEKLLGDDLLSDLVIELPQGMAKNINASVGIPIELVYDIVGFGRKCSKNLSYY